MSALTMDKAKRLIEANVREPHLLLHALAVSAAMGAMAEHFGEGKAHWEAIGYLHDVDYEKFPEEHLDHTRELIAGEDIDEADIRAILSHGYGLRNDVLPRTSLEKSLYTVDELTGIVQAASLMRPTGLSDLEVSSLKKKFKDKKFAAKCSREVIQQGCDMLGLPLEEVMELVIRGMREHMEELGLGPRAIAD
ncbi:MAG TPA: HD domain-containing protein [Clostridia bacterium]|nr:HD domain-containing protein [Clostridia bacterium]